MRLVRAALLAMMLALLFLPASQADAGGWYGGCDTVNCLDRRASGVNGTMWFRRGEAVVGWEIWINGQKIPDNNCSISNTWGDGYVHNGAANYWWGEDRRPCNTHHHRRW